MPDNFRQSFNSAEQLLQQLCATNFNSRQILVNGNRLPDRSSNRAACSFDSLSVRSSSTHKWSDFSSGSIGCVHAAKAGITFIPASGMYLKDGETERTYSLARNAKASFPFQTDHFLQYQPPYQNQLPRKSFRALISSNLIYASFPYSSTSYCDWTSSLL